MARQRIAAARAGLEQANAAFWPRLQFQSGYTRTDNPMMAFGSILNQQAYPSVGLNLPTSPAAPSWPLPASASARHRSNPYFGLFFACWRRPKPA